MSDRSTATDSVRSYVDGRFRPVESERTVVDLPVTGTLPVELAGTYVRIGPNPVQPDATRYHLFTGDGMVHGVRLAGGRARWYRNRWVRTPDVSVALGEPELSRPAGRESDLGPVNTNVARIAGRALALVEAGPCPVELTGLLATRRITDFGGTLAGSFSAHPKLDPRTGRWHAITYHWRETAVHHLVVGPDGRVERDVTIDVGGRPMVHDTAITASSILVFDLPVTFDFAAAGGGSRFPYHWDEDRPARVGVVPLDGDAHSVRWCEVPSSWVFHTVNAVDLGDGTVAVDLVRWNRVFDRDRLGPSEGPTRLERWLLDPRAGTSVVEVLDERSLEFPRVDDRFLGGPLRYAYAPAMMGDSTLGARALHRYDLRRGTVDVVSFDGEVQEFSVVPRHVGSAEGDAWLIGFVTDHDRRRSDLVVLAADDPRSGPVATVHLPVRVPDGFHGNWLEDR